MKMKSTNGPLQGLDPQQRSAVTHGIAGGAQPLEKCGPLLIVGGAGTGRTTCLAHRIANLVVSDRGDAGRILVLTASGRAAQELTAQIREIVDRARQPHSRPRPVHLEWAGTFQAIGARVLRRCGDLIGVATNFTVLGRSEAVSLVKSFYRQTLDIRPDRAADMGFPNAETCLQIFAHCANTGRTLRDVLKTEHVSCLPHLQRIKRLREAYSAAKIERCNVDVDDLLVLWRKMMRNPKAGAAVRELFDHVLVDDYQGTNVLQADILSALKPTGAGVTIVKDATSPIGSFRIGGVKGAAAELEPFSRPAKVIWLRHNYRATGRNLRATCALMKGLDSRCERPLRGTRHPGKRPQLFLVANPFEQSRLVAERIVTARDKGVPLAEQAVLFPAALHSHGLEIELNRRGIRFRKFGGASFMDGAHIKDVLAFLKWAENPADRVAGRRVLGLVSGVSEKSANHILHGGSTTLKERLSRHQPSSHALLAWRSFYDLMIKLENQGRAWPADLDEVIRFYDSILSAKFDNADDRYHDFVQLRAIAAKAKIRRVFLDDVTLNPFDGKRADDPDAKNFVTLATFRAAKGREFRHVQILQVVDGSIPSARASSQADLDKDQHELCVAAGQAKDDLAFIAPRVVVTNTGGHTQTNLSPFLTTAVRKCCSVHELIGGKLVSLGFDLKPDSRSK